MSYVIVSKEVSSVETTTQRVVIIFSSAFFAVSLILTKRFTIDYQNR